MNRHRSIIPPLLLAVGLLGFSPGGAAAAFDINVNNDTALFRYLAYDGRAGAFGKREMDVGLLFTTDEDYIAMFGAQVIAEAGSASPGLEAGVGLKLFLARSDVHDVFAVTLGGQVKYSLPPYRRLVVGAEGFYSPKVVTFEDGENFGYFNVYLGYEVLPKALVYIGYRESQADIRNHGKITIESGGHLGLRFEF